MYLHNDLFGVRIKPATKEDRFLDATQVVSECLVNWLLGMSRNATKGHSAGTDFAFLWALC